MACSIAIMKCRGRRRRRRDKKGAKERERERGREREEGAASGFIKAVEKVAAFF